MLHPSFQAVCLVTFHTQATTELSFFVLRAACCTRRGLDGHGAYLPVDAELLQGRADGNRGLLEVVVRDLREKEVVRHVPVRDVVVGVVDAPPVLSVHRLHRRRGEVEVRVVKRLPTTADKTSGRVNANRRGDGGGRESVRQMGRTLRYLKAAPHNVHRQDVLNFEIG